jgi:phosphohistidine swiveling domain-containing protein
VSYAHKVSHSGSSDHIDTYREAQDANGDDVLPSVLVQRMVKADTAGVAFAADPITGDTSVAVVAATSGTGESLVGGEDQGDTWRIDSKGRTVSRELQGRNEVLTKRQIAKIVTLVREVSEFSGKPQDIEWAFEGKQLYLLQSRDITTLKRTQSGDSYALWDNSNIVESYGGVTTPLTFSVARSAYQEAYRHMGRALGVSERSIAQNERAYEQMIGLIQGRVYYNLLNWYRLLMLTPGFRFNRRFMEQMMGVTEGLPADAIPMPEDNRRFAGLRASAGLARVAQRLIAKLFVHNSRVRRFHRNLDDLLRPVDLQTFSLDQLIDSYESLQANVIPAWDTPLVNDLYCMIFHGALRHLSDRWLDDDLADIHNDLVSGESGIISVEPVRRMKELAGIAADDQRFIDALCDEELSAIVPFIAENEAFQGAYTDYIGKFGDRCLDELKLESATLNDNPLPLLRAVGQLARSGAWKAASGATDALRLNAEEKIADAFRGQPIRKRVYELVLRLARARVRDRENLRFERTRVYGRVRAIFVEIGQRLVSLNVLNDVDDIFYLDVAEITGMIRGTGISAALSDIVDNRRNEFAEYRNSDDPPRRFITNGPAQLASSMQEVMAGDPETSDENRRGQACSQGIVRGPVRIVRDPRDSNIRSGEILVAQRTDPGWVTIFPLVTGMIMERGSLLSHSAIVARELGIPAVVGVDNACSWLEDGDWVELNGATGTIRRINATERAA